MTPLGELNDSEVNCLDDTAKQKILHTDISLVRKVNNTFERNNIYIYFQYLD